ncbi:MAG TPA: hypothetical protein IAC03_08735 [Candidatus Coprenecus pullistercoris]|nr:hypothetical protein [Candidatus Coprenecus pullistercoris]
MTALYRHFAVLSAAFLLSVHMYAQRVDNRAEEDFRRAAAMHRDYMFDKAVELYGSVLGSLDTASASDTALRHELIDRMVQCQNGMSMMQYVVRPHAVASMTVPADGFFLYLQDMGDGVWLPVPNPFIKVSGLQDHPYSKAMYFSPSSDFTVFSAPDSSGSWKLYCSDRKDSVTWSAPRLLSSRLSSGKNEIFPVLSQDGKTVYFASDGMPGMGGYDLFYSTWDEEAGDWSMPENMGFPYSSTGDDILYYNSGDGRYSVIVSDRSRARDSVTIYVTDYMAVPVRTPLKDGESPLQVALFIPAEASDKGSGLPEHRPAEDNSGYSSLMHELRRLRNDQRDKLAMIEESRGLYAAATSAEDRDFLASIIKEVEEDALVIKKRIDSISAQVRRTEMSFLSEGIIPEVYEEPEKQEKPRTESSYRFERHEMGRVPYIVVETPEPEFDYTFRISRKDGGQFAPDLPLPDGIIYQIQFAVLSEKAGLDDIRGMSPVFAVRQPSGKWLHTVGLFRTYEEAAAALPAVRSNGFRSAYVIAYRDGREIKPSEARSMEGRSAESYRIILSGYQQILPAAVITAVEHVCGKDISKSLTDEGTVFTVGPFDSRSEAEDTALRLTEAGVEGAVVETIQTK